MTFGLYYLIYLFLVLFAIEASFFPFSISTNAQRKVPIKITNTMDKRAEILSIIELNIKKNKGVKVINSIGLI